jgi:hypothetical protein
MKNTIERFIGHRFGKLVVLGFHHRNKRGQSYWLCQCACGKQKIIRGDHLLNCATRSCGCNQRGVGNHQWKGCGEIGGWTWNNYRIGAKARNISFHISVKEMWEVFLKQNRKCALSGVDLCFSPTQCSNPNSNASMDRIESSKGYTVDNIQWVTKDINLAKRSMSQDEFIEMCRAVTAATKTKWDGCPKGLRR